MKKKLMVWSGLFLGVFSLAPIVALAQVATGAGVQSCGALGSTNNVTNIEGLLCKASTLLNAVVPVLIALGVVYFVFGVIMYVIASDEEAKKKGRNSIIFGLIGLAVIIGLWGLVRILTNTFVGSTGNAGSISLPTVNY